MTKQKEIREGMRNILIDFANRKKSLLDAEDLTYLLSNLREYLHSQGVVIKVDRELPDCDVDCNVYATECDKCEYGHAYHRAQRELGEAGYVAVEPLIEEELCKRCKGLEAKIVKDLAYALEVFKEEGIALGYSDLNF